MPTPDEIQSVLESFRDKAQAYVDANLELYEPSQATNGITDYNGTPQSVPGAQEAHHAIERRERCPLIDSDGSTLLSAYLDAVMDKQNLTLYEAAGLLNVPRGTLWNYQTGKRLWRLDDAKKVLAYPFASIKQMEPTIVNTATHDIKQKPVRSKAEPTRTRKPSYRPYLPAAAGVLIRMEAARRGVTSSALICGALGIAHGETD